MGFRVRGLRVQRLRASWIGGLSRRLLNLGFGVRGLGFGFGVWDLGFGVWGSGFGSPLTTMRKNASIRSS